MKGKKTTLSDAAQKVYAFLSASGVQKIACGIILRVHKRRDHKISIKVEDEKTCIKLSVTGKYYKQELRIYDGSTRDKIIQLLKEASPENIRIIEPSKTT